MYSQGSEEKAILEAFADHDGIALDIGAYDGKTFSNTRALIEKGWGAVLVEPSPVVFQKLLELYRQGRPDVKLVNALISASKSGFVEFWDSMGDAISTTETANREVWAKQGSQFEPLWMYQVAVARLFEPPFPRRYDFINIDTEGTSTEIFMKCLQFLSGSERLPEVFCVEHDNNHEAIRAEGSRFGYKEIYFDGNNIILDRDLR